MRTVSGVRAVPHLRGERIDLTWSLPPASDFEPGRRLAGVRVVRRERTFPRDPFDGDVVYDGAPVAGVSDAGLAAGRRYYYAVFAGERDEPGAIPPRPLEWLADQRAEVAALATADFGSTAKLYSLLPGIHQVRDAALAREQLTRLAVDDPKLATALAALPLDIRGAGQLRRFLRAAAAPLDLMRSTAEALSDLHDVDVAPPEYLPQLARWLDWDADTTLAVHEQRNEVKFAPRLYRAVGTVESLRRLVTRYTGWYTRAAEMDQALLRSNQPAQLNVYAAAERGGEWLDTEDASTVLGFGPGNRGAAGADGPPPGPAELTGSAAGPFALRPGMELTIEIDDRLPVTIRFQPGDFADIGAATAAEVAGALRASLTQLTAAALPNGRLQLTSNRLGAGSALTVDAADAGLVSLDGAPRGRLAAFADGAGRLRLVFAAADPLEAVRTEAVRATLRAEAPALAPLPGEIVEPDPLRNREPAVAPARATDRILVKTWTGGRWQAARPLAELPAAAQGEPAAAPLGTSVLCAWVEDPGTPASRLRYAIGEPTAAQPAWLIGTRTEPFAVEPGTRLSFRGRWRTPEGAELARSELVVPLDPARLTASELVNLLKPHLVHVDVTVGPRNQIVFATKGAGGDERLELDLDASTAAVALGFGPGNASARGDWGDALEWSPAADVPGTMPGRYADTFAAFDPGANEIHLFWARHADALWRIETSRFDGVNWTAPVEVAAGGAGNREPFAVFVAGETAQLLWSQLDLDGRWSLRRAPRSGAGWGADTAAVPPPPLGGDGDREPAAVPIAPNRLRVFLRSDRSGAAQLWAFTLNTLNGVASAPVRLTAGAAHRFAPAPVAGPDGRTWLLHRGDANVALSRAGVSPVPEQVNRITQPEPAPAPVAGEPHTSAAEDAGARRRFAGGTTLANRDSARIGRRREWDDLIAYTPQRTEPGLWQDDDLYTRGTVGLHLSPAIAADPLTERTTARLQGALKRFLPAQVRAVVVLRPDIVVEDVYTPGHDIGEQFTENYPFADAHGGVAEAATVSLPTIALFISAAPPAPPAHFSASDISPTNLRSRSWFPPPA